jgi:hypothetical protein
MPSCGLPDARSKLPSLQRMALDWQSRSPNSSAVAFKNASGRREMDQRRPRGTTAVGQKRPRAVLPGFRWRGDWREDGNGGWAVPRESVAKVVAGGQYAIGLTGDYDISPDGSRFLMIKDDHSTPAVTPAIVVVQN